MKPSSLPSSPARKLLGAAILPVSLALTVLAHAADHAVAAHHNPLFAAPLMLGQVRGPAVPFEPAQGLGLAVIVFGLGLVHLSRSRRRLRRLSVTA